MQFNIFKLLLFSLIFALVALVPACGSDDGDASPNHGDEDVENSEDDAIPPWKLDIFDAVEEIRLEEECKTEPCLGEAIQVVPSDALPGDMVLQDANNNLDVAEHNNRIYLAFRTAPSHFASPLARLYVVSTADRETWRLETTYTMGTDLREPRLLSWKGELFLYFAVLGEYVWEFTPKGMMVMKMDAEGSWSEPDWFYEEGFIPWRARVIDGVPYMLTYVGGENIYDMDGEGVHVHWLTTENGVDWEPVIEGQPVVLSGGVSETDFTFLDDGTLIAVSRNEAGDEQSGWGMKICRAEADSLGDWNCVDDPKKYDSPLVFGQDNRVFLIGRRNLTETGYYDLGVEDPSYREMSFEDQSMEYELAYWQTPKRCSLWEVDSDTLEVNFILDLPSAGDTCFASAVEAAHGQYEIYNYSSPFEDADLAWVEGQTGKTLIHRMVLSVPTGED